jgi:uncharacterized protein YjiS (DUF1127 family)
MSSTTHDHAARAWLTPRADDSPAAAVARDCLRRLATFLWECRERSRQRRHLQMLDDDLLRDIGVTHADAEAEACKWPWMP